MIVNAIHQFKKNYFKIPAVLILLAIISIGIYSPTRADAGPTQLGVEQITLNPGGGILDDATDGLRFTINAKDEYDAVIDDSPNDGQDEVVFRGTTQYCCSAGGPILNIGGTSYGQSGAADNSGADAWDSIQIISTSGSTSTGARTSTT